MAWYCYTCTACGDRFEDTDHRAHERFECTKCGGELRRDYRRENTAVAIQNLKDERNRA